MPEISTAGFFQVAFIARQMEQTPRAFFQTTFGPIGRVCAARHARGGLGLQGKWRTRACVPYTYYIRATTCLLFMKEKIKMKYINIITLTTFLIFIDLFRIFSKEIQSMQNENFREMYYLFIGLSFAEIILLTPYQKSKNKIIKYIFNIIIVLIIMLGSCLFFHPFVSIFSHFSDHKGEVCQTFIWSSIAFVCGLITSCMYYKISEANSFFLLAFVMVVFIFLNTFSGFPWVEQAPIFTGIYCLFGSFLGSELCSLYETKKQNTE